MSTVNDAFYSICRSLNSAPEVAPRGQKVREILNHQTLIKDPRSRVVTWVERKVNKKYLLAEWIWYCSGDRNAAAISEYAPFWTSISDSDGNINSNYGHRLFGYTADQKTTVIDHHQFNTVVEILKRDKDSRQAICHINLPGDISASLTGCKDVPCTLNLIFHIRDNCLHMTVSMRSNDCVLGFVNDVFQFTMMQELMLNLLKPFYPDLKLGYYYHNAASMHVYERHYGMINSVATSSKFPYFLQMKEMQFSSEPFIELEKLSSIEKKVRGLDYINESHLNDISEFSEIHPYWQNLFVVCYCNDASIFMMGHFGDTYVK